MILDDQLRLAVVNELLGDIAKHLMRSNVLLTSALNHRNWKVPMFEAGQHVGEAGAVLRVLRPHASAEVYERAEYLIMATYRRGRGEPPPAWDTRENGSNGKASGRLHH